MRVLARFSEGFHPYVMMLPYFYKPLVFYFLADVALCVEVGKQAQLNGTTKAK